MPVRLVAAPSASPTAAPTKDRSASHVSPGGSSPTTATPHSTTVTPTNVTGSAGATPYNSLDISRVSRERDDQTGHSANDRQRHSLTNDEPTHRRRLRAQRDANSDLMRASRDRIAHDTVDADRGQRERDRRERGEQHEIESRLRRRAGDRCAHRLDNGDRDVAVDGSNLR